jgi:hypothetical protein
MAKKRSKNRSMQLLLAMVALIVGGFLFRRTMLPRVIEIVTTRPADPPADAGSAAATATPTAATSEPSAASSAAADEHLGSRDRRALDDLLRSRSK